MPLTPKTPRGGIASWFSFGRDMHLIVISGCAANIVHFANLQYIPMYIRSLGGSIENLGFFFTLQIAISAVLVMVGGWLVDHYNRRILFSLTPLSMGVASVLMAIAPSWPWLIPGMVVSLIGTSIGGPIFFSMTSDLAPRERRGAFFGYLGITWSVSTIVGPLVGGYFFQYVSYRWFLALGAILACSAGYLRSLIHDPRDNPDWVPEGGAADGEAAPGKGRGGVFASFFGNLRTFGRWAVKTRGVVLFMLAVSLPAFGGTLQQSYFPVYLNEVAKLAPAAIGVLVAISGALSIPANLAGGRLGDAIGRPVAGSLAYLLGGLWLGVCTLVAGFGPFAALYAIDGLVIVGLSPSIDAWHADVCPSRHRGTYRGALSLLSTLLAIPAPLAGSWLWGHLGPSAPLRAAAAIAVATGLILFAVAPRLRRPAPEGATRAGEAPRAVTAGQ